MYVYLVCLSAKCLQFNILFLSILHNPFDNASAHDSLTAAAAATTFDDDDDDFEYENFNVI